MMMMMMIHEKIPQSHQRISREVNEKERVESVLFVDYYSVLLFERKNSVLARKEEAQSFRWRCATYFSWTRVGAQCTQETESSSI
jgi:hypothetical protein